jgi:hypothetical protein
MSNRAGWLLAVCALMCAPAVDGQTLPAEPIRTAGGRLVVSGELSAIAGEKDERAYFNYTDYEHNALRMIRLAVAASFRIDRRLAVLADVRTENLDRLRPYALYVRFRPWLEREFDVQAGRIPPTFGSFSRRSYASDNLLIGYPLAYQYLTSLRPDAVPAGVDDLLRMRGRGWLVDYPLGATAAGPGVPLVTAFRWDTGVQARVRLGMLDAAAAVTTGTLANPRVTDDNGGKQVSGRAALQPAPGLVIGVSAARGAFLSDAARDTLPGRAREGYAQRAFGADVEYSRDHWLIRAEAIVSDFRTPDLGSVEVSRRLRAAAAWVEGRYRITPRVYAAGRLDRLVFSRIAPPGGRPLSWDAPVTRVEAGAGYYLQRNLVAKVVYQYNWRDGGRELERGYPAAQLLYWF